jgi:non-heme chloroperoxidase
MRVSRAAILLFLMSVPLVVGQAPRSAFIKTSDGVRIHYLEAGSGRPIVLVPGWTMPAWIWEKQIDEFSKKYHVIAVDPRSQGESDKPLNGHLPGVRARDYKEVVDQLSLKRPLLVGWSMGCGELMKYVENFGTDNVSAFVLVDCFLWDKPDLELYTTYAEWMNEMQTDRPKVAGDFVRRMYKKPQTEDYLKRVTDASMQVSDDTAIALIYDMLAVKDFSPDFARINRPVLFAYQPQNQPTADLLKSKLGEKLRLERFDGDGHALFVDEPEKFNRVVEEFVSSAPE